VAGKNYSVNRQKKGAVIYEVDGALYSDLSQVPDEADRAVLAGMGDSSSGQEPGNFPAGMDDGARAADAARTRMIFLAVFGSIAVIMLAVAVVTSCDAFARAGAELQAPGVVVDTVEEPGDEDTVYSYPVVSFTDIGGTAHTVKVPEGSSPPEWAPGDAVTVLYDPGNPETARIDSLNSTLLLWLVPFVSGAVGIGFLAAVLFAMKVTSPETG
jgi:hypothetical protein